MDYYKIFETSKRSELYGRYITNESILPVLQSMNKFGSHEVCGWSVQEKPIYSYRVGSGKIKILAWSQMHGNESTTTKAIIDFINYLDQGSDEAINLKEQFSFYLIPILNPDGAIVYTRENANGVDLNRDARNLTQPESIALKQAYERFGPDYCFNMHDQRSIFGVGNTNKPATVSFLAPSYNEACEINECRSKAIQVIAAMNKALQFYIPGQVGRFDDTFNINCVGDSFQQQSTPTILIEAGHFPEDYEREVTRRFVFIAFLSGMQSIYENVIVGNELAQYLHIPQNKANFFDLVYKNIKIDYDNSEIITNFAAQYDEVLSNNAVHFNAFVVKIGDLYEYSGHFEFDAAGEKYFDQKGNKLSLFQPANFRIGEKIVVHNGKPAAISGHPYGN